MIWYDLLEESQCQEQQFDRRKPLPSQHLAHGPRAKGPRGIKSKRGACKAAKITTLIPRPSHARPLTAMSCSLKNPRNSSSSTTGTHTATTKIASTPPAKPLWLWCCAGASAGPAPKNHPSSTTIIDDHGET